MAFDRRKDKVNPISRLSRLLHPLSALALALILVGLIGLELWHSHGATLEKAERNLGNLALVLSEQMDGTMRSVSAALGDIAGDLQDDPALAPDDAGFRAGLSRRLGTMPYVRALFVIGADGFITHDTDYPTTPRVSLADRPYFQAHRERVSDEMLIGHPLVSRSVNVWFVSATRRVNAADGSFAGVAVAAVEPLYFEQLYRKLWLGDGTISLFLRDGTLLARAPADDAAMGRSFAADEPFATPLRSGADGSFWARSPVDGKMRLTVYRALADTPLVLMVAESEEEILRPWWSHAATQAVGAALLICAILLLEWLAWHFRRREERALAALEQARRLETIGRFASGIAHDIGNLKRIISSSVRLLRPHVADRPEAVAFADLIDQSLESLRHLVDHLLSYSRGGRLQPRPNDLRGLLVDVQPILRQAAGPRIELGFSLAEAPVVCHVDAARFQSSVLNLVLNARDAMPAGGAVTVGLAVRGGAEAEVSITDQGHGMSQEMLARACDPFYTTKAPGAGSGIGLHQVSQFMAASGGRVEVSSVEGASTVVRLLFPLAGADAGAAPVQAPPAGPEPAVSEEGRGR